MKEVLYSRNTKIFVWIAFLLQISVFVSAQIASEPDDEMYREFDVWKVKGLIERLPSLRPYSLQLIDKILGTVLSSELASPEDKVLATYYSAALHDGFHAELGARARSDLSDSYLHFKASFWSNGEFTDWLSVTGKLDLYGVEFAAGNENDVGLVLPAWTENPEDFFSDQSDVAGGSVQIRQMLRSVLALGEADSTFTGQIGLSRASIGPFFGNGLVFGPQAPISAHFALKLNMPDFTVQTALFNLIATDDALTQKSSNKYLFYHELTLFPAPWIDLSIFETAVTGGRLNLMYLVPLSVYFETQGLGGFADNTLVGFSASVRPISGLSAKGLLYIDDLHFNDIVRFQFNTKWKLAFQTGIDWNPSASLRTLLSDPGVMDWLSLVSFDYSAVMPYTYTHLNTEDPGGFNYGVYTNAGVNIGPALEPNSDRIEIELHMQPFITDTFGRLGIELSAKRIRHGNASAGIIPGADGGIFDPGYLSGPGTETYQPPFVDPTGQPYTRFLTQSIIESTMQLGIGLNYHLTSGDKSKLERGFGQISLDLAYTFQHKWNANLIAGLEETKHFLEAGLSYSY